MKIVSSAFAHKQHIPAQYTCQGEGINPPLQFLDVSQNAKSLALIVDDPDAVGGLFVHWVVFNLPATTTEIAKNTTPVGVEGKTGIGDIGYFNPCPPKGSGTHRYFFTLYALDTMLALPESVDKQAVITAMQGHILDQAELVGLVGE